MRFEQALRQEYLEYADGNGPDEFSETGNDLANPFKPRYNLSPSQMAPVVLDEAPTRLTALRWGLIPQWAKDEKIGFQCINARSETIATKNAFRDAWKKRHCLVPAEGFYEWEILGPKLKQPWHFLRKDDEPFAFAGLWESWRPPGSPPEAEPLRTFTIITGPPNEVVAPVHDRMPVIVPREKWKAWLSPETPLEERAAMLRPYPAGEMRAYRISARVSFPANDDPSIIEPATVERPLPTRPPKKHPSLEQQGELFG
jgi:putative SOS response-associated peptidase YedK